MSAELVDPFATHEPLLTPEEWQAIRDEVFDAPWNDPSKVPDCLKEALKTLGEIGTSTSPNPARDATQCLRRMVRRAVSGVPYGEVVDDWPDNRESLIDREPGLRHGQYIRRVNDVVEDL